MLRSHLAPAPCPSFGFPTATGVTSDMSKVLIALSLPNSYWGDLQYESREECEDAKEEAVPLDAGGSSFELSADRNGCRKRGTEEGEEEEEEAVGDNRWMRGQEAEAAEDDDGFVSTLEVLDVLAVVRPAVAEEVLACIQAGIPWKRVRPGRMCVCVWGGGRV